MRCFFAETNGFVSQFHIRGESSTLSSFRNLPRLRLSLASYRKTSPSANLFSAPATTGKLRILMPISQELLEILVCPVCKAKVVLKEDGSGLKCVECHRVYPVRDDIPVMLVDQATIEP
jgi:uncharacterized protein